MIQRLFRSKHLKVKIAEEGTQEAPQEESKAEQPPKEQKPEKEPEHEHTQKDQVAKEEPKIEEAQTEEPNEMPKAEEALEWVPTEEPKAEEASNEAPKEEPRDKEAPEESHRVKEAPKEEEPKEEPEGKDVRKEEAPKQEPKAEHGPEDFPTSGGSSLQEIKVKNTFVDFAEASPAKEDFRKCRTDVDANVSWNCRIEELADMEAATPKQMNKFTRTAEEDSESGKSGQWRGLSLNMPPRQSPPGDMKDDGLVGFSGDDFLGPAPATLKLTPKIGAEEWTQSWMTDLQAPAWSGQSGPMPGGSVADWLRGLGLARYVEVLLAEGFDDFEVIHKIDVAMVNELVVTCRMPRLHARILERGLVTLGVPAFAGLPPVAASAGPGAPGTRAVAAASAEHWASWDTLLAPSLVGMQCTSVRTFAENAHLELFGDAAVAVGAAPQVTTQKKM